MVDLDAALGVLGYNPGEGPAGPSELRARYQRLVKIWHPDRFVNDADTAAYASSQLAAINNANALLRDALARGETPVRRHAATAPGPAHGTERPRPRRNGEHEVGDSPPPRAATPPRSSEPKREAGARAAERPKPETQAPQHRQEDIEDAVARGVTQGAVNIAATAAGGYMLAGCLVLVVKAIGWLLLILFVLGLSLCTK
jgi:curved DNA-binding protein CbpA